MYRFTVFCASEHVYLNNLLAYLSFGCAWNFDSIQILFDTAILISFFFNCKTILCPILKLPRNIFFLLEYCISKIDQHFFYGYTVNFMHCTFLELILNPAIKIFDFWIYTYLYLNMYLFVRIDKYTDVDATVYQLLEMQNYQET